MGYPHYSADCYEHWPAVTICGSMRFFPQMLKVANELTTEGNIVLMPFVVTESPELKEMLDSMHKRKIDMSHTIYVVSDETGYVGESTKSEIAYAHSKGRRVIMKKVAP